MRRGGTNTPVVPIASIRLQVEVLLDLLLQLRQVVAAQALEHALRVDNVQLMVFHLLVQDGLLRRIDEAQRHGEPVNRFGAAAPDTQRCLLLGLLQHKAVFIGDPGFFRCIGGALCRVIVICA